THAAGLARGASPGQRPYSDLGRTSDPLQREGVAGCGSSIPARLRWPVRMQAPPRLSSEARHSFASTKQSGEELAPYRRSGGSSVPATRTAQAAFRAFASRRSPLETADAVPGRSAAFE